MNTNVVGLDIAKNIFHFYSLGVDEKVTKKKLKMQLLHNIRQDLVDKRTALVNQLRGLLLERGIVIAQGINHVRKELQFILEDAENGLTHLSRELFAEHYDTLKELDKTIKRHEQRIGRLCHQNQRSKRFLDVPGVTAIKLMVFYLISM